MRLTMPVTTDDQLDRAFGKADRMAVVDLTDGRISGWQTIEVGWREAHDSGGHGAHHARIVRFMKEHEVDTVVFSHMGEPMLNTLGKMGLTLIQADQGNARAIALGAARLDA